MNTRKTSAPVTPEIHPHPSPDFPIASHPAPISIPNPNNEERIFSFFDFLKS